LSGRRRDLRVRPPGHIRNGGKLPAHFALGTRVRQNVCAGRMLLPLAGASYPPEEDEWG
jgi:hypothetical protein